WRTALRRVQSCCWPVSSPRLVVPLSSMLPARSVPSIEDLAAHYRPVLPDLRPVADFGNVAEVGPMITVGRTTGFAEPGARDVELPGLCPERPKNLESAPDALVAGLGFVCETLTDEVEHEPVKWVIEKLPTLIGGAVSGAIAVAEFAFDEKE